MGRLTILLLLMSLHFLATAQRNTNLVVQSSKISMLISACNTSPILQQHPFSKALHYSNELKNSNQSKGLLIAGCVSVGLCAGLIVAGTTLATQPVNSYTEGIIFLGTGLGMGVVAIPLIVLSKKYGT